MRSLGRLACAAVLALVAAIAGRAAAVDALPYRLVPRADAPALLAGLGADAIGVLEQVNRADHAHLGRLDPLLVPLRLETDPMAHSPLPPEYQAAGALPKLLVVDLPWQAFGAYEHGRLVHWGPISSGRRADPTPGGAFHLTWKSLGRHSTENPRWYMRWYFNFDSRRGLALHAYALPGHPASHACVRLLSRDARWLYAWGDQWTLGAHGEVRERGTPVLVTGTFDFDAPPPWRRIDGRPGGAVLPATVPYVPHREGGTDPAGRASDGPSAR